MRGRRVSPRASILLSASVDSLSGRKRVSLLEVSLTGARLEGAGLPAPGSGIILACGPVDTFGTVIWAAADRRGIEFDEEITVQQLLALQEVAATAKRSGVNPEELQAMADWANGLAR
jgi:hypothetical protein